MAKHLPLRTLAAALCVSAAALTSAVPAAAQTVSTLPAGTWSVLPETTAAGSAAIVSGPGTPPAGTGSLHLHVAAETDRVLVGTDLGSLISRPWSGLGATYSTYVAAGGSQEFTPTLRFAGFQTVTPAPANFTTLSFEPKRNGTFLAGQWQSWTLGPDAIVWQTNTTDGFCGQGAPCTFAAFVAQYPQGAWGQAQLGIGTGVVGPADGFADDVTLVDGATTQNTNFDPPPTTTRSPSAVASPTTGPTLPLTGTRTRPMLIAAGLLLITGFVIVVAARRRVLR
ncbi:LPXTG cell wall anchor domain-containing protein [Hamadaea tsunoensis]|uniref:LPXTG cell wall anchor domain-containing protein n=1 Tax=Hamadaea tsunoensis TaxID=53368 RepID=UPI00041E9252|nr:LPXTG cell wall anchor domain-containing protein [Hamadaea tsunoensis]